MIMPLCPAGLVALSITSGLVPLPNYVCVDPTPRVEVKMEGAYHAYTECVKAVAATRLSNGAVDMRAMQECARVLPKEKEPQ